LKLDTSPSNGTLSRVVRESGVAIALIILVFVFSMLSPLFLTAGNISNIFTQIAINVILAVGMTFVILIGGIDLSVGSVMALCAVIAGTVMKMPGLSVELAILLAVAAGVLVGAVCGLFNGLVSGRFQA
jgi:ribose transport system permease protein